MSKDSATRDKSATKGPETLPVNLGFLLHRSHMTAKTLIDGGAHIYFPPHLRRKELLITGLGEIKKNLIEDINTQHHLDKNGPREGYARICSSIGGAF